MAMGDGLKSEKINRTIEKASEFLAHLDILKSPGMIGSKVNQDINVAAGVEVISDYGSKEGKLSNMPTLTKSLQLLGGDAQSLINKFWIPDSTHVSLPLYYPWGTWCH